MGNIWGSFLWVKKNSGSVRVSAKSWATIFELFLLKMNRWKQIMFTDIITHNIRWKFYSRIGFRLKITHASFSRRENAHTQKVQNDRIWPVEFTVNSENITSCHQLRRPLHGSLELSGEGCLDFQMLDKFWQFFGWAKIVQFYDVV